MIDIRKLKELVRLMVANDLSELDLRDSEEQVTLRRPNPQTPPHVHVMPSAPAMVHAAPPATNHAATATAAAPSGGTGAASATATADTEGLVAIESPMVGTYYSASAPDSPPFIKVGDKVSPDTVTCLIEAMKIFNEIKAECSGTIRKIMVKNGEAVEFGQPLFMIKPD